MRYLVLWVLFAGACATHEKVITDYDYYSKRQQTWFICTGVATPKFECHMKKQDEAISFDDKALIPFANFEKLINNQR